MHVLDDITAHFTFINEQSGHHCRLKLDIYCPQDVNCLEATCCMHACMHACTRFAQTKNIWGCKFLVRLQIMKVVSCNYRIKVIFDNVIYLKTCLSFVSCIQILVILSVDTLSHRGHLDIFTTIAANES